MEGTDKRQTDLTVAYSLIHKTRIKTKERDSAKMTLPMRHKTEQNVESNGQ